MNSLRPVREKPCGVVCGGFCGAAEPPCARDRMLLQRAALIFYGLPLLGLLAGMVLALWLMPGSDLSAAAAAFSGLAVCMGIARRLAAGTESLAAKTADG